MAKSPRKKTNGKLAQKNNPNSPVLIARVLIFIGKPIYFVLTRSLVGIIFILYSIGHATRISSGHLIKLLLEAKNLKKSKSKPKKVKPKTPKSASPYTGNIFKLWLLRLRLSGLKFISKIRLIQIPKIRFRLRPIVIIVLFTILLSIFYFLIIKDLPSPRDLTNRSPEVSTKIYDRNGNLLYKIYKDKNRTIVPLSKIPKNVQLATLAAEDAEFYNHPGFSIRGISRAIISNFKRGSLQGGSTITQQLVKNVLLTPERTITRKIKELILSVEVESKYSKDEILEMYLNEVSYGGTAYGIEEAAESYFGKSTDTLSLAEGAFLAGLPKSPTLYSPFGQNPDLAFERQKEVLHLMNVNKFISESDEQEALNTPLTFIPNKKEIKAPHFVMYIRQLLVDKYGEEMVEKGGLEVTTTLDLPIQEASEKIVSDEVTKLKGLNVGNGAAIVMNPQNGEILSMVGSKNYFDINADGNVNVALRLRQPGSSIKLINYAYALSKGGYTPASIIDDTKITYVSPGSPPYSPVNYDGKFLGKVTLRSALAQSRNIPAVKILASYGVDKMIELGKSMGLTTWDDPSNYGLSLTLGGGAVKMIDLAQVYSTVANYGKRPEITSILQVKDFKGMVLENNSQTKTNNAEQILDPSVAYSLIDILKDNVARAPAFGFNSSLVVKNHPEVAVKTGTSNDLRDNWTAGFNQNYLVITWVGNNDNSPMSRVASGITGASPIWNKIMSTVLQNKPSVDWEIPTNLIRINCLGKGEWFLKGKVPANYCSPTPSPLPKTNDPINKILDNGASTVRQ